MTSPAHVEAWYAAFRASLEEIRPENARYNLNKIVAPDFQAAYDSFSRNQVSCKWNARQPNGRRYARFAWPFPQLEEQPETGLPNHAH